MYQCITLSTYPSTIHKRSHPTMNAPTYVCMMRGPTHAHWITYLCMYDIHHPCMYQCITYDSMYLPNASSHLNETTYEWVHEWMHHPSHRWNQSAEGVRGEEMKRMWDDRMSLRILNHLPSISSSEPCVRYRRWMSMCDNLREERSDDWHPMKCDNLREERSDDWHQLADELSHWMMSYPTSHLPSPIPIWMRDDVETWLRNAVTKDRTKSWVDPSDLMMHEQ